MTDLLLKQKGVSGIIVCFANTGKEEQEALDFVHAFDTYWNGVVIWLEYDPVTRYRIVSYETASRKGEPFEALITKRRYLPNVYWRFCTQELKVGVIKRYMRALKIDHWTNVIGIRYDEPARWSRTLGIAEREGWDTWLPLVEWRVTKSIVLEYWKSMPFDLKLEPYLGNCDLCFLKGRNRKRRILTEKPEKAKWWIEQEERVSAAFCKSMPVKELLELIRTSPTIFDYEDPDFECFCNTD